MLKLYNTLSGKKETFKPRKKGFINLFVCGPTVYDYSHLGHARTYIAFDVAVKYLKYLGYKVFYLQNITDIDDKIINRAKEKKITAKQLAKHFEKEYLKDVKSLGIDSCDKYARATDNIKEIIRQVERLIKKGFAYRIEDGIYYNITKFKDYGKLSKRTTEQAEDAVSRVDDAKDKKNKGDFCLWKFSKEGEPKWKSPWGSGRPGWHIEDTAITEKYFGPQYDIHGGAKDLIFPHHEAEIAQMEAISGKKPLVKYWLHTGFLTVNSQKMAKSLGNFITIKDFLIKESAEILRFFMIKSHYRSPVDYNERFISQTREESGRIAEFVGKLKDIVSLKIKNGSATSGDLISKTEKDFKKAMDDDLNTPKALAAIFELVHKGNSLIARNKINSKNAKDILNLLDGFNEILGVGLTKARYAVDLTDELKIKDLMAERESYRQKGQWQKADGIREKIKKMGYWVEDTKEGPKIKKI